MPGRGLRVRYALISSESRSEAARACSNRRNSLILRSTRANGRACLSSCRKRLRSNSRPRLALHEVLPLDLGHDGTTTVARRSTSALAAEAVPGPTEQSILSCPPMSALRCGKDPFKPLAFLVSAVHLRERTRSSVIVPEAVEFKLETLHVRGHLPQWAKPLRLSLDGSQRNAINYTHLHPHRSHGSARRAPARYPPHPAFAPDSSLPETISGNRLLNSLAQLSYQDVHSGPYC